MAGIEGMYIFGELWLDVVSTLDPEHQKDAVKIILASLFSSHSSPSDASRIRDIVSTIFDGLDLEDQVAIATQIVVSGMKKLDAPSTTPDVRIRDLISLLFGHSMN